MFLLFCRKWQRLSLHWILLQTDEERVLHCEVKLTGPKSGKIERSADALQVIKIPDQFLEQYTL